MDSNEQRQILNFLYAVCSDRLEQYRNAQDEINEPHFKELFSHCEQESAEMMSEIHQLLDQLGLEWEEQSTLSGDLHNLWIDFRSKLSGHDTKAILKALLCAEEANLAKYAQECDQMQINEDSVQILLLKHYGELKNAVQRLRDFIEKHEKATEVHSE